MEKRFLDNEKDVTVLSEIVMDWVPNLWTPYQPLVSLATGKEAPTEIVDNVKYIKQRGEKAMNEFISRFTFNEGSPTQKTYYDSIIKPKVILLLLTGIKRIQLLQKRKISLFVEYYHVMTTPS